MISIALGLQALDYHFENLSKNDASREMILREGMGTERSLVEYMFGSNFLLPSAQNVYQIIGMREISHLIKNRGYLRRIHI